MPLAESPGKKKLPTAPRLAVPRLKTDPAPCLKNAKALPKQHPWKVVHACELAREVLPLVEGQLAAGMRPSLLTPGGFGLGQVPLRQRPDGTTTSVCGYC